MFTKSLFREQANIQFFSVLINVLFQDIIISIGQCFSEQFLFLHIVMNCHFK